ncbi:MAG: addiction module protein [Limisphaerales bacterium]
MNISNLAVAEEALSLPSADRAGLARLLIQSLENDPRTDAEIRDDLARRLDDLVSAGMRGCLSSRCLERGREGSFQPAVSRRPAARRG